MRSMIVDGACRVDAALEAVTGIGREIEASRATGDRFGPPEGRLDIDVARGVGYGGRITAHDAGQRFDGLSRRR